MDPVLTHIVALSLSLLFGAAAIHKLRARAEFRQVLLGYQLIPAGAIGLMSVAVPLGELVLAAGLLLPATRALFAGPACLVLVAYGLAIWINLRRGNLSLDCGCQMGQVRQTISMGLVVRNMMLGALALLLLIPQSGRALNAFDYGAVCFGLVITPLLYVVLNTLIGNATTWREINS